VADIGGVADLAHLPVADYVHTGGALPGDGVVHRLAHGGVKCGLVVLFAAILRE
jgi:hypothetical protein